MEVKKVVTGYYEENCYILKDNKDCLVVDPGDDISLILNEIGDLNVLGILITHAHFDHIGALDDLLKKYNVPVYYRNVNNEINAEKLINLEEKEYKINNFKFKVIFTEGHRNDLVTYYFYEDKVMFTGDFLFYLSIGRTDMEYGNPEDMIKSINKIKEYDDDITIYPGHSGKTTLGFEKKYNEYLR